MTVRPFGSKLIIFSLHKHLSVTTLFATATSSIDGSPDRLCLGVVRSVVLLLKRNLPFPFMIDNEILLAVHLNFASVY